MNRLIIAVMMMLAGVSAIFADVDIPRRTMVLTTKGGETVEFRFVLDPIVTFSGTDMVLTDINDDKVTFPIGNVAYMKFADDTTGIDAVAGDDTLRITLLDGTLTADGLKEGALLTLHDMNGVAVASVRADGTGRAEVAVRDLAKGIYAVSAAGHSFKFIK